MENQYKILIKIVAFFLFVTGLISCKENGSIDKEIKESLTNFVKKKVSQVEQNQFLVDIKDYQGIWESFSFYLEHESEFKDYNKNKYYKIVNGKETLDVIVFDNEKDSLIINNGYIGFLDSFDLSSLSTEKVLLKNLEDSGKSLVRFEKGLESYSIKNVEVSSDFNRYFDVVEILEDGFIYGDKSEKISFKILLALPENIFKILKNKSKTNTLNYIKEFNIYEFSSKIKIVVDKTFFYSEMSETSKRKAFLVKGDIAYLESLNDRWAKVYYDGKIVSGGYVKIEAIEVIN